jgi:hypothetical protein
MSDTVDLTICCMASMIHIFSTIVFYMLFIGVLLTSHFLIFIDS